MTPERQRQADGPERQTPRWTPWWMVVIGASYIVTLGMIIYLLIWGPAELRGFVASFSGEAMVVGSVDEDSQVAKGGLREGDRVLTIDGRPVRNARDWTEVTGNLQAGRPQQWLVSRGSDRVTLEIVPAGVTLQSKLAEGYVQYLSLLLSGYVLGFLIAWKRAGDPVARFGAWFIITASMAFGFPIGWAVPWRALPGAVQLLLWIPQLSRFVLEGIFLSFFVLFPRRLVRRRWVWFAIWIPVLLTLPWRVQAFNGVIHPGEVEPVPAWILTAGFLRTMLYLLIGIVVLGVSYRRFLGLDEKRRVRVLMAGTAVSLISAIVLVWFDTFPGRMSARNVLFLVVSPLNSACPLALAYAMLRHRVLDVAIVIRQGLQYALARGAVIGVVPALAGILVLDLSINSDEPLAAIIQARGWIYAALGGVALVAYWQRKPWLEALDRRFFREQYNAQRVLRDVVDEIREAGDLERVAPRVAARIETALHPEFVSLMVRHPDEPQYRALASSPSTPTSLPLAADSKLVALMRALEKPLDGLFTNPDWVHRQLPVQEMSLVQRARVDLLVPIAMKPGHKEALLVLGVKRSEQSYTREDRELLEAIASSLGLLLEKTVPVSRSHEEIFEECPDCGTCYDSNTKECESDQAILSPVHLPRMLAGRYHLERRRGRGGMGSVYEATDNALERRVAVKVIRDDWVGNIELAQRFRREARAAASFAHPNVVTVHDFGVEGDTRGFLVMELLEGVSLREELRLRKRLDPSRIIAIFRGVCAAVEAAHQRQLIHRDLKPENIFLASSNETEVVKVLDFGIAKSIAPVSEDAPTRFSIATEAGVLMGTPAYMSPEQLLGERPTVQWDLWALAVVAYECLTGALPFAPSTSSFWRHGVLEGRFMSLDRSLTNPPAQWEDLFVRSFDPNPVVRARSADEFLHELGQALKM